MVQIVPLNYNNEHYKAVNYMNGEYQQVPPPPPPLQHQQQMPIPMAVPMMNHLIPPHHPHHQPPNFFHHPPPPPPPHQPMYTDQTNGQYMDYGQAGYHPNIGFMHGGNK